MLLFSDPNNFGNELSFANNPLVASSSALEGQLENLDRFGIQLNRNPSAGFSSSLSLSQIHESADAINQNVKEGNFANFLWSGQNLSYANELASRDDTGNHFSSDRTELDPLTGFRTNKSVSSTWNDPLLVSGYKDAQAASAIPAKSIVFSPELFTSLTPNTIAASLHNLTLDSLLKSDPSIIRSSLVNVDWNLLTSETLETQFNISNGRTIRFSLFNDVTLDVELEPAKNSADGQSWVWVGKVAGAIQSEVILVSSKDHQAVIGNIRIDNLDKPDEIYEIRSLGNGIHIIRQLDQPIAFSNCPICGSEHSAVLHSEPQAASSGDSSIDPLLSGFSWNANSGNTITYSFYSNNAGSYYGNETVSEVNDGIKNNLRKVLSDIESLINVDFVEVADTTNSYGQIRYMFSNGVSKGNKTPYDFYAYAYYPGSTSLSGDVHLNPNYESNFWNKFSAESGNHGYETLIHETLHALGLKHPGNYNKSATGEPPYLPFSEDNNTNTVMTYNGDWNIKKAVTPMPYDIKALQYLYGAKEYNTGTTSYSFDSVYRYTNGNQYWGSSSQPVKLTIWDSEGLDTLNFSNLASSNTGYRFDLNPGGILTAQDAYNASTYLARSDTSGTQYPTSTYGTAIAYNTVIENLINSTSNDYIIANSAANKFSGYVFGTYTGNDFLASTDSLDILDLSTYNSANVTLTPNGNDLLIGLGNYGSITIGNYYGVINPIQILWNQPSVDLSGQSFNIVPASLNVGDSFNAEFSIQNTGAANAGAFDIAFYLSSDPNIGDSSDRFLTSYSISSLAGNSNTGVLSQNFTLPSASDTFWSGSGIYYIGMVVDSTNAQNETNESNNASTANLLDYESIQINPTLSGPANDNFANRIFLNGTSTNTTSSNLNATQEVGEPLHANVSGGKSLWWSWIAPYSGSVTLTTANSNFDTTLGVYTGTVVSGLTNIASNDDSNSTLQSQVTFNAIAGTPYQIAVDGYYGSSGNISLALQQTSIELTNPVNLYDGASYLWDISSNGSIVDGTSDAYDYGLVFNGFPNLTTARMEESSRELVLGSATIGNVSVTRKIYVPQDQSFARFLEIITNPGLTPVTYTVDLNTNLGSDGGTIAIGTSSGDTTFTTADNWIVTDDGDATGDPTMLHVLAGSGGQRPTVVSAPTGLLNYRYDLTLQPGETKIAMHFAAQNPDVATALAKGSQLAELGLNALAGMSDEELGQLVNFAPNIGRIPLANRG